MKRKSNKKKKMPLWIKIAVVLFAIIAIDLIWYSVIIDIKHYKNNNPEKTAFMKYREKQWKEKNRKVNINQIWVPLNSISPEIQRAVVVAEDGKFWKHDGFDFDAMRKAVEKNIKKRKMAVGASTITMQLAKNMFLSPSKTPVRKINEAILTWRIEHTLTKKRILELYLNVAEWGDGVFGIEAASRTYFHHSSIELNKRESALLASVLPNPIRFSPLRNSRFVDRRSKLIRRALGGDLEAAIALHNDKMLNQAEVDIKDTSSKADSVYLQTEDSSSTIISQTVSDSSDSIKSVPAVVNDSNSVDK